MLAAMEAHLVLDQTFELKAQDDRSAEGIVTDALPFILIVKQIEVVAGIARGIDMDLLEDESLRRFGCTHHVPPVSPTSLLRSASLAMPEYARSGRI